MQSNLEFLVVLVAGHDLDHGIVTIDIAPNAFRLGTYRVLAGKEL